MESHLRTLIKPCFRRCFNLHRMLINEISKAPSKRNHDTEMRNPHMLIVTIAFNDDKLISKQAEPIKKYITDEGVQHMIIDNSSDNTKRALIKKVCHEAKIKYVAIPAYLHKLTLPRFFWNGMSHGAALNWTFYHIINYIKPEYFAILDHDLLPLTNYNMTERIGQKKYFGVERLRTNGWYLWPGFSIFNYEFIAQQKPDFLPIFMKDDYLDAGGGNYIRLYKKQDPNSIEFMPVKTYRIKKNERTQNS